MAKQPVLTEKSRWRAAAWYFLVLIVGIGGASIFWYFHLNAVIANISAQIKPVRQTDNTYQFIDPLLGYEVPGNVQEFDEYQPLKNAIEAAIPQESSTTIDGVGVYFRDLTLGRWAGVNEDTTFAPGSMMKVVIMIAYFKEAEDDPSILNQSFTYSTATADELNGIPFETPSNLQVGQNYTVTQLIDAMIMSSDNGAKNVLLDNINQNSLAEIYTDLGLPYLDPTQNYDNYAISSKQYSVLLKTLYNATYLSRAYSEEALDIMSQAEYNQGLVAGIPTSTPAAQKFGESVDSTDASSPPEVTLSNCGIIYYPAHPYILCVMAKGENLATLTQTIASISEAVWAGVDKYVSSQSY